MAAASQDGVPKDARPVQAAWRGGKGQGTAGPGSRHWVALFCCSIGAVHQQGCALRPVWHRAFVVAPGGDGAQVLELMGEGLLQDGSGFGFK